MRLTASRSIAVISCFAAVAVLCAARRPRYGGVLRIETHAVLSTLDPAEAPSELTGQIFETLVRADENGDPQPWLATGWTHEPAHRRWVFTARPHVTMHNGATWDPPGGIIAMDDKAPIEDILRNLSKPESAIVIRGGDGSLIGTGPFRIAKWDPKKSVTLEAHDTYWGGRPYLDQVEIQMGRPQRDQALDFELGKVDVIEIPVSDVRRGQQRGSKVVTSAAIEVMALVLDGRRPEADRLREALSLSVDRTAIHNVLLQKQGEITAALLPQWISGYAFLFSVERNLAHAHELEAGAPALSFTYDRQTPLVRSIAERIILNAAEAGITLRPASGGAADLRLATLLISSPIPRYALEDLAKELQAPLTVPPASDPANLYELERALINTRRVIPLLHLPVSYQLAANVRGWPAGRPLWPGQWHFENVWLDEKARP